MFEPIFKNTVTLITGASRGIGLACAQRIAQRGGHVIGLARRPFDGELLATFTGLRGKPRPLGRG